MKKILSVLSTLTLASSATLVLTSNVDNHMQQTKTDKNEINWSDVKKSNDDYFKNLRQSQQNQKVFSVTASNPVDMDQVIDYAEQQSNQYLTKVTTQNLDLDQTINFLSQENSGFKATYENSLVEQKSNQNLDQMATQNLDLDQTINFLSQENSGFKAAYQNSQSEQAAAVSRNLSTGLETLRTEKAVFKTISASAAVAAVGFWAAAWWFGISIPWAVGCTVVSVSTGIVATLFNTALTVFDPQLSTLKRIFNVGSALYDFYSLGKRIYKMITGPLVVEEAILVSDVWSFPPSSILISVFGAVLAWADVYN